MAPFTPSDFKADLTAKDCDHDSLHAMPPRGKPMTARGSPRQSQNTGGDEDRGGAQKSNSVSSENLIG